MLDRALWGSYSRLADLDMSEVALKDCSVAVHSALDAIWCGNCPIFLSVSHNLHLLLRRADWRSLTHVPAMLVLAVTTLGSSAPILRHHRCYGVFHHL